MVGKRNSFFIAILLLLTLCYSCSNNKTQPNEEKSYMKEDCPVIFYEFPKNVMRQINEEMKDRNVIYASVHVLKDEDNFNDTITLNFTYSQKSNRINKMAEKSNRKMKLNGKEIPILFSSDFLYSNEPKDTLHYTQDFNFATFKFDQKGHIIEKVKF